VVSAFLWLVVAVLCIVTAARTPAKDIKIGLFIAGFALAAASIIDGVAALSGA
jgi:hypothetical protein